MFRHCKPLIIHDSCSWPYDKTYDTQSFVRYGNYYDTRLKMSHSDCALGFVIFPCPTHYRASSVKCLRFPCPVRADIQNEDSLTQYDHDFWSRSTFTLHLRRRYLYYIIHLIVPYSLFCFTVVFIFILQPSRPERLSVGNTSNTFSD